MKEKLTILVVEPDKPAYPKTINNTLESLQAEVGGYIQPIYAFEDPVAILCNDEGKLQELPKNRGLFEPNGTLYDIIYGTFIIVGAGKDDFISLNEAQLEKYKALYSKPVQWLICGNSILMFDCEAPMENHENPFPKDHDFYVYPHTIAYAVKNNEVKEYQKSMRKNENCAAEIELAIRRNYDSEQQQLKEDCIYPVLKKFGYERIFWVLIYYLQKHLYDGRISSKNKEWVQTFPFLPKLAFDANIFIGNHIGLVDLFTTILREKVAEVRKLCADIQAHAKAYIPDYENRINEILLFTKTTRLEELMLSRNTDPIYDYLQSCIDSYQKETSNKTASAENQGVHMAKELLSRMVEIVPMPGTVLKLTSNLGVNYAFIRVTNKQPCEVKNILEQLLIEKADKNILIDDLAQQFKRTSCTTEAIGTSEDHFTPHLSADIEFCWDTMHLTDLREEQ